MSRRHAAFNADLRDVIVRDLGSTNGILVNGVKTAEAKLRNGDVVQIGHLQVRYVDEVGPFKEVPAAAEAAATKLLDPATLASDFAATKKLPS
jgi:pSer/pThr/pTyr-binding forkhead associated (FHA) protein